MFKNKPTQEELKKQYVEGILSDPNYYINERGNLSYRSASEVNLTKPSLFDKKRRTLDYASIVIKKLKGTKKDREVFLAHLRAVDFLDTHVLTDRNDTALAILQDLLLEQFRRGVRHGQHLVTVKSKKRTKR